MTITWETNVVEVVWESQTAPGITWTTVVGDSGGGTEIPARRLLPNTVGTPGQIPAVNEAGTAVEYVDAPTGGSFPTYSSAIADLPTDPSTGESWVPSDAPGALFWDGTEWTGAIFNVDAGGNLGGVVSTPADGTVILSGRGRFVKVTTSGLEFGSVASIYAANIDPSADGWVANTGSMLLSSAALWRKTGSADTDWAMIGGGGGAVDSVNGQTGVVVLTASDVGTLDTGGITTVASDYAADALADANSYTDTAVAGKQTADADLTAIAALAPSDDALIQRKAGAWTSRTPAQVKADMSIGVGDVSGLDENTRDVIGTALVAGSGVAVTVDDPGNTITIAVSGVVADAINDGVTTVAPSQNAVFDALALTAPLASPTFTGTVTVPDASFSLAKLANIATARFLGRRTASSGPVEEMTIAQVKSDLGVVSPVHSEEAKYGSSDTWGVPGDGYTNFGSGGVSANTFYPIPFVVDSAITVTAIAAAQIGGGTAGNMRLLIYAADVDWQASGAALLDTGSISTATNAVKSATGLSVVLTPGRYLRCFICDVGGLSYRVGAVSRTFLTPGIDGLATRWTGSVTYGAPSSPVWNGHLGNPTPSEFMIGMRWTS